MSHGKTEVMVPEEAAKRGPIIKGELRSSEIKIPGILAQFSNITPQSKKAKIYLYPTLEQAKRLLQERSPFAFTGSFVSREGVDEEWSSTEIWIEPGVTITHREMRCLTHVSGRLVDLHVKIVSRNTPEREMPKSAWFVMNGCLLLQILATHEEHEIRQAKEYGIERPVYRFTLSDGATAEIRQITVQHSFEDEKEIKKRGFAIQVDGIKEGETVKRDIDRLLILASLASREQSVCWHWSANECPNVHKRHWRFGLGSNLAKRPDHEEPLVLRDAARFSEFLSLASKKYLSSSNGGLVDTAVFALLARELPLEVKIVRLLTGVQSALRFAVSPPEKANIGDLYREFQKQFTIDLSDLWPLHDKSSGVSLSAIRNAAVHGDVFTERDWIALSYAEEHLRWTLERILLVSLGWGIKLSSVSPEKLRSYCAYDWKGQQQSLKL